MLHDPRRSREVAHEAIIRCEDNLAFMSKLESESMKLIVTSPPYNIGKSYEVRSPLDAYIDEQKATITECIRLLHPLGSICWQVGNHVQSGEIFPLDTVLYPIFKAHGLRLRNRIIWHFEHGLHCSKRLSGRYETLMWFTKSDNYTFHLDPIRVPSKYPGKKHFKGPKAGQLSGNPWARIQVTSGYSQTSKTITSRRPYILASFPLSSWSVWSFLSPIAVTAFSIPIWAPGRVSWRPSSTGARVTGAIS